MSQVKPTDDFLCPHNVICKSQKRRMSCWYSSAKMVLSFRTGSAKGLKRAAFEFVSVRLLPSIRVRSTRTSSAPNGPLAPTPAPRIRISVRNASLVTFVGDALRGSLAPQNCWSRNTFTFVKTASATWAASIAVNTPTLSWLGSANSSRRTRTARCNYLRVGL